MAVRTITVLFVLALFCGESFSYLFHSLSNTDSLDAIKDAIDSKLSEGKNIERSDEYEGDIRLSLDQMIAIQMYGDVDAQIGMNRGTMKDRNMLWLNRVVAYNVTPELENITEAMAALNAAIEEWEMFTCIKFVRRTTEEDYIEFFKDSGCWSYVGRQGGMQHISLDDGCWYKGTVVHEIGHAMGFWHEQSRPDRDTFVEIVWDNIPEEKKHNFLKYNHTKIDSLGVSYDYYSVMHYSATAFGGGNITIKSRTPGIAQLGQRLGMTDLDIQQADLLYQCNGTTTRQNKTPSPYPVPQGPDNCDFESGLCEFKNVESGDEFDWTYRLANTPSKTTGPDGDHTTGRIGFFMYIEASYPRKQGDVAIMESKFYNNRDSRCLNFFYHMTGKSVGSLEVYRRLRDENGLGFKLFEKSGNQLGGWIHAKVELQLSLVDYQIVFKGVRGSGYSGDIAVDDIFFNDISQCLPTV